MFEAPKRRVDRVFIHCSASDMLFHDPMHEAEDEGQKMLAEVTRWHLKRGFDGVGYHYLINKSGSIIAGRDREKAPAAQKGHNTGTIAIMVHGLSDFSASSMTALTEFCGQINEAYSGRISFHGHCEVSWKACPVFNYRKVLSLDRFGRMP